MLEIVGYLLKIIQGRLIEKEVVVDGDERK